MSNDTSAVMILHEIIVYTYSFQYDDNAFIVNLILDETKHAKRFFCQTTHFLNLYNSRISLIFRVFW